MNMSTKEQASARGFHPIRWLRLRVQKSADAQALKIKELAREQFILTHWDELQAVGERVADYDVLLEIKEYGEFNATSHLRQATFTTLSELDLLMTETEMRSFMAIIQERENRWPRI